MIFRIQTVPQIMINYLHCFLESGRFLLVFVTFNEKEYIFDFVTIILSLNNLKMFINCK